MTTNEEITLLRIAETKLEAAQSFFAGIGLVVDAGEKVQMTKQLNEVMRIIQQITTIKEYTNHDKKYAHTNGVVVSKASA